MSERKLFVVAGEASGDTHAARLIRAAKARMPGLRVEGLGGEAMREAGCNLRVDLVASAAMGFIEVARNIRFFRRTLRETREYLCSEPPDALVLVDYPGFNLRLAAAARRCGIPVIYYISPQVWAWRPGRIKKIAKLVDKMIVILPFEEEWYRRENVDVTYVGHPLLDSIAEAKFDDRILDDIGVTDRSGLIGLLPGSRRQEIEGFLPTLIETARAILDHMPDARFLIPCSSQANKELVERLLAGTQLPVNVFLGKMYDVVRAARCCLVASGTATLEVACFHTPLIVVYKTGRLAWIVGWRLLTVSHISLVNIIAGKEIVPEMLQSKMNPDLLARETIELCRDGERRENMIGELKKVRESLGTPGACERAAEVVCGVLEAATKAPTETATQQKLVSADG